VHKLLRETRGNKAQLIALTEMELNVRLKEAIVKLLPCLHKKYETNVYFFEDIYLIVGFKEGVFK
jgi:hypothetical protein